MSAITTDYAAYAQQQAQAAETKRTEMGQDAFLRLMTEQLKHQDPMKPLDGNQFLGQLAQFSTVKGIEGLNKSFADVSAALSANQSLQGASMIGRSALIPADYANLGAEVAGQPRGIDGAIFAEGAGTVRMEITDASGQKVRTLEVPASEAGDIDVHWDGTDAAGRAMPAGEYHFKATYLKSDGTAVAAVPMLSGRVDSVVLSPQGLILNLAGIGQVPLSAVRRIG